MKKALAFLARAGRALNAAMLFVLLAVIYFLFFGFARLIVRSPRPAARGSLWKPSEKAGSRYDSAY